MVWDHLLEKNSSFWVSYWCSYLEQGERDGIWAWHRINRLFNWLPLAALIEKKIICMHGGIGRSINHVEQIENIQRPITMEAGSIILMDLLWLVSVFSFSYVFYFWLSPTSLHYLCTSRSDPTENDSVEGLRPNARGPGLVTFGVSNSFSLFFQGSNEIDFHLTGFRPTFWELPHSFSAVSTGIWTTKVSLHMPSIT